MRKQNVKQKSKGGKTKGSSRNNWRQEVSKDVKRGNYQDAAMLKEANKYGNKFPNDRLEKVDANNDAAWYYSDENILNATASYSFEKPLGSKLNLNTLTSENISQMNAAVPGLMSILLGPAPGIADNAQDPLNLGATNVYSFVRYKNSGARNYDSPDLMLYLLAMDSIYSCWAWLKRIYGYASTYSNRNRYMPRAYAAADNVDFEDLINNLADFRAFLNVKASEIAAFAVPATMSYHLRHVWMFSNIYKDSNTVKAQQYMYVPAYFYKYDETSSPQGGKLVTQNVLVGVNPNTSTRYKVKDLKDMLNNLLEAVNYSEDIGIMSGDIIKAYGESGLFTLSTFDADYKVEPVYSQEVLTQIENSTFVNCAVSDLASFAISQDPDTNFLKFKPVITAPLSEWSGRVLNFHWENPTPKDVIVATRLMVVTSKNPTAGYNITSCGSEIAISGYMFGFAYGTTPLIPIKPSDSVLQLVAMPAHDTTVAEETPNWTAIAGDLIRIAWLFAFDWAPRDFISAWTTTPLPDQSNIINIGMSLDYDMFTIVSNQGVEALNLMALLKEFNVPN